MVIPGWRQSSFVQLLLIVVFSGIAALLYLVHRTNELHEIQVKDAQTDMQHLSALLAQYQNALINDTSDLLAALTHAPVIRRGQWDQCHEFLAGILADNPRYANLGVVEPNGHLVCSATPLQPDIFIGDRPWIKRALATKQRAIGSYYVGRLSGQPSIGIGYPVLGDNNAVELIIYIALRVDTLSPPSTEAPLHLSSIIQIFDAEGTLLSHIPNDPSLIGQRIKPDSLFAATRKSGAGSFINKDASGASWLFNYRNTDSGIGVAISSPLHELLMEPDQNYWRDLLSAMTMLASLMLIGWLLAHAAILQNLRKLLTATQRINAGDFSARSELPNISGELSELGESFDEMATRVENTFAQMHTLTARLEGQNDLLTLAMQQRPLNELLVRLIDLIESHVPGAVCLIATLDAATQTLHPVAAPNLPEAYIRAIDGQPLGPQSGSCGMAAYARKLVIVEDIATDPRWQLFRASALNYGLRACWARPIIAPSGDVLGACAMYFWTPRAPDSNALQLLEVAGNLAALTMDADALRTALANSTNEHRYLFENNPSPMWVFDTETLAMLDANSAAATHYGYSRDEFRKLSLRDLIPEQDLPGLATVGMQFIKSNDTTQLRVRHRHKSGKLIEVNLISFPIQFGNRRARFVIAHDMTAAARAERNLAERDRRLALLLESTMEGIYGTDIIGRISFANRACAKMLGYDSAEELIGLSAHAVLHHSPNDSASCNPQTCAAYQALTAALATHEDNQMLWSKDGLPVPVEIWFYPMTHEGLPDGAIVTFIDISWRKSQSEASTL